MEENGGFTHWYEDTEVSQIHCSRDVGWRPASIIVVLCARHSGIKPLLSHYQSQVDAITPENQINGFTYYRYDPNTNRLRFAVSVGSLRAENA
ncbi:MAG: hypothetical protein WAK60_07615 [Sedimentisphaerales bacterium]